MALLQFRIEQPTRESAVHVTCPVCGSSVDVEEPVAFEAVEPAAAFFEQHHACLDSVAPAPRGGDDLG